MTLHPPGTIAVIFLAMRTGVDEEGYQAAGNEMSTLAKEQPGYCGEDHARSEDGLGITVSYWKDDDHAKAWRNHPGHAAIRDRGRGLWYEYYTLHVAQIERSYDWQKSAKEN
ncbi:MAG: antibiotic biosynthesis monooxygenase [Parasphingorhabdus sp.]